MNSHLMRRAAKPMLFLAAFIWGTSFFIMKNTLDSTPVLWLLTFRFSVGAVLLGLFCWKRWGRSFTWDYVWRGAVMGTFLFTAYATQTFGLVDTTPSKNAFLTATYCVLVPFLYWAVARQRPDRYNILAALMCVTGVGLVSLTGDFTITRGDLLTLLSALFYTFHIVAVNKLSVNKDVYLITVMQFAFTAIWALSGALLFQSFPAAIFSQPQVLFPLAYLCVMCTTVALLFQNVGQVWSDPSSASVILSLESVFGVLFSVLFYGDPVTPRLMAGFALIFVAVICSETKFAFLRPKKKAAAEETTLPGDCG